MLNFISEVKNRKIYLSLCRKVMSLLHTHRLTHFPASFTHNFMKSSICNLFSRTQHFSSPISTMMFSSVNKAPVIWWVRNDIRVHDNLALDAACRAGSAVLPVYVFDEVQCGTTAVSRILRVPKMSPLRSKFLLEAVADLKNRLKAKYNVNLIVRQGNPATELAKIASAAQITKVFATKETCTEELKAEREVRNVGLDLITVWNSTLVHIDDLPFPPKELPLIYTQFRKTVEAKQNWVVRAAIPLPSIQPYEGSASISEAAGVDSAAAGTEEAIPLGELPTLEQMCGEGAVAEQDPRAVLQFRFSSLTC